MATRPVVATMRLRKREAVVIRLSANLTMLFGEHDFLDRLDAASASGFGAIECVSPYGVSPDALRNRLMATGLQMALFNFAIGDWEDGERGIGANPERRDAFFDSLDIARTSARATDCRLLHLMAGKIPTGADRAAWRATLVANIQAAADVLRPEGIDVVLEPVNTRVDIPGYFYDTTASALEVIDACDRPNVKLLYDIYHMQVMEGDVARTLERLLPRIGHIQLADNPGRHEPGTGEINYAWLLPHLNALGYRGWVGCEYKPAAATAEGLAWAAPYLRRSDPEARLAGG